MPKAIKHIKGNASKHKRDNTKGQHQGATSKGNTKGLLPRAISKDKKNEGIGRIRGV
jgi:hypothetical protein